MLVEWSKNGSPIDFMTYDNRNYGMHVIVKNKNYRRNIYFFCI